MIKIRYNGEIKEFEEGIKIYDAFADEIKKGRESSRSIIACRYNNVIKSLGHRITEDR